MGEDRSRDVGMSCPLPVREHASVQLAHGGGGRLMHELIERTILPAFGSPALAARHDAAVVDAAGTRIAFTTDSYVVRPLFFPGGDIGSMAVHGTVNDLAMAGARPLWLSAGLIIEEGFPMETLRRVLDSMAAAARHAGVEIVTGDTKVVDRGKGDGLYVNTAGIGIVEHGLQIGPASVRAGDAVVLSGDLGRHGIAVLAEREGLRFDAGIESDSAPLWSMVEGLLSAGIDVRCLRDLTRGGLASALNEIAEVARTGVEIEETAIPVSEAVRGACELLGFDPLYVANEGRFVAIVAGPDAGRALAAMRAHPQGRDAALVGRFSADGKAQVRIRSRIGAARVVDMLSGDQLPRIC